MKKEREVMVEGKMKKALFRGSILGLGNAEGHEEEGKMGERRQARNTCPAPDN